MVINAPRLLDKGLNEKHRLRPEKVTLKLDMTAISSARMVLPFDDAKDVEIRDFIELFTPAGTAGLFHVRSIDRDYITGKVNVEMQHSICLLADQVPDASLSYAAGTPYLTVLTGLLAQQAVYTDYQNVAWRAGRFIGTGSSNIQYAYTTGTASSYPTILTTINEAFSIGDSDLFFTYDQSTLPWKININQATEENVCECRMSRNINALQISVDTGSLVTRIYPIGQNDINISSVNSGKKYIDADASTLRKYGYVTKSEKFDSATTPALLQTIALQHLERYKKPSVSLTLRATDLSEITGESVDTFRIGWACRIPLPQYGETYTERIVGMEWNDLYGTPDRISITLSNKNYGLEKNMAEIFREYYRRA